MKDWVQPQPTPTPTYSRYESNITKHHSLLVHLFGNYALNTVRLAEIQQPLVAHR
jgi:hypothetical protein